MSIQVKVATLGNDVTQSPILTATNELFLTEPSQVLVNLAPEDITSMRREGDDLIIELANGEELRITNFYDHSVNPAQSELFLTGDNDQLIPVELTTLSDGSVLYAPFYPIEDKEALKKSLPSAIIRLSSTA